MYIVTEKKVNRRILNSYYGVKKTSAGYSLVELMVAISVLVILFGSSYARFREFQRRQMLDNVAKEVKADLRYTQEMALAGRKPDDPACNNSTLISYTFRRLNANSYNIQANCTGGDVQVKDDVVLPTDVNMLAFGSNRIVFNILGRGNTSATIRIQRSATDYKDITVTSSGTIQ